MSLAESNSSYYVHDTAIIDDYCTIGKGTKIWHFSHVMTGAIIGDNCTIGQNVFIAPGVVLGNHVKVQNNVSIYTGVYCEDYVFLGPSMVFINVINPRSAIERKDQFRTTLVKRGASIGANATIICGNNIGAYAMVGAGTVVTREVKPYALFIGNPGRQSGWMSEYGHKLRFDEKGFAECPESKQAYRLQNDKLIKQ